MSDPDCPCDGKDFEKVPAYRMKDGRVLSKEQALYEKRLQMLVEFLGQDIQLQEIAKIIAADGDKILSILQQANKSLD